MGTGHAPQSGSSGRIPGSTASTSLSLTVFDGGTRAGEVILDPRQSHRLSFGRDTACDVVVPSATQVVSRRHGMLLFERGGWVIEDANSVNGIMVNGTRQRRVGIVAGDVICIGRPDVAGDCVVIAVGEPGTSWTLLTLQDKDVARIGRAPGLELTLPSPTVSALHATIVQEAPGHYSIRDERSCNGTFVMGRAVHGSRRLAPGDLISIALTPVVFTGSALLYAERRRGVEVVAHNLVQVRRGRRGRRTVTTDHVSLRIPKGSFTAIVGGSGAGKSTLLDELNGTDPATSGEVFVDGIELYPNYERLKSAIGYVPQSDIVHGDLSLADMLGYAAELRMPPDTTRLERERRVAEVMDLLELGDHRDTMVGRLSGGQRKRASIAVELLADTRLLFLDEPTSGLDPGIERSLMQKLAQMAHDGRTIVLVTHTTLNLHLCDQVVFMAPGGGLAFEGAPSDALAFFGVDDFVPIYDLIARDPSRWVSAFAKRQERLASPEQGGDKIAPRPGLPLVRQVSILSRRYLRLVLNDRPRLLLLLGQAPVLAGLICLVCGSDCFRVFESTKSCLFALSCAAFWVGILDSIQEICKERSIVRRELGGGLKVSAYVLSKLIVLGGLCILQAFEMCLTFVALQGPGRMPAETVLLPAPIEVFVTLALLTLSAMCLGLWVSSMFSNPDRAIALAPLLIMPQVLFSGLIFELSGVSRQISLVVNCRWSMEALGTTANLNALDLGVYGEEVTIAAGQQLIEEIAVEVPETTVEYMGTQVPVAAHEEVLHDVTVDVPSSTTTLDATMLKHELDEAYLFTAQHLLFDWSALAAFCVVCSLLCGITLRSNMRK